jgi:acetolactate decarboxylase
MKHLFTIAILFSISVTQFACNNTNNKTTTKSKLLYQCPMKCEDDKTYDTMGKCPVCEMDLEKIDSANVNTAIKIVGEMRNVMHNGQLQGIVNLDTIANKQHSFGLGPIEYLTGEILLLDGKCYKSTVVSKDSIKVEETNNVKAPFFGYSIINSWKETPISDTVLNFQQLENYLNTTTKNIPRPYFFKITATVNDASFHIVNLPKGTKVTSPEEAHKGLTNYSITNQDVELLGFFSTKHKAIFTHHDTFLHVHLITTDKKKMGHLENIQFKKATVKMYLPN